MADLLRLYKKLLTDLSAENNADIALPLLQPSLFPVLKNNQAGKATPIVKQATRTVHVHQSNERALNLMAVHNIDKWLRNEYDRNLYKTERNLMLGNIFISKAHIHDGLVLLKATYKTACKYQHTHYAFLYAQELAKQYAMADNPRLSYNFERALSTHVKNLNSETRSLSAFRKIVALLVNRWDVNEASVIKIKQSLDLITAEKRNCPTHTNITCYYRAGIYYYQSIEAYSMVIAYCSQWQRYLKRNRHLMQDGRMAEIAHYLLNACIARKKIVQGTGYFVQYSMYFNPGNVNYIAFKELYMQLLFHGNKFTEALQLYKEVTATAQFKKSTAAQKEIWEIYKAYLDFSLHDAQLLKVFKTARFLNIFENVSKDKQGLNFEMLVITFIYKLIKGNTDDVYAFGNYFEGYIKRNIKRKHYYRSYYFSHMLLLIYKYNFNALKIEAIGVKFVNKLRANPYARKKDKKIIEIIPYEKLWQMIVKLLKEKK